MEPTRISNIYPASMMIKCSVNCEPPRSAKEIFKALEVCRNKIVTECAIPHNQLVDEINRRNGVVIEHK